jgi:hypothetical protein
MSQDLFFCTYCDADLLKERINKVAEDQNISDDEARELIDSEGEIGLCYDCHKEQEADF